MIFKLFKINISTALIGIITLLFYSSSAFSNNSYNEVIVSGQVTNYEQGSPVAGHPVYIESELSYEDKSYSNIVYTDRDGYYFDTINTSKNKGSLKIFTHDQYGEIIDTTLHFRFLDKTSSFIISDFRVNLPVHPKKLQALFSYSKNGSNRSNLYSFFDQTDNENIIDWYWDFGDGIYSHEQNPKHEFVSYGLFRVTLMVRAIIDSTLVSSKITKQINITRRNFYHIGGHVFSDHFPIDKGFAFLYLIDSSNHYHAFDTVAFDTLGYYYFYQIPEANYVIKAQPAKDSEYYGILLPTYYGNSVFWENSEICEVEDTSWEFNIRLEKSAELIAGNGGILGNVMYIGDNKSFNDSNAEGVNIYLIDQSDNTLSCSYSDSKGGFGFSFIELNSYYIYPDVTGISADKILIELTQNLPIINNLEIRIINENVSYIFHDANSPSTNIVGNIYPNPASDIINIPLNINTSEEFSFDLYGISGEKIKSGTYKVDNHNLTISTSDINNGLYIFKTRIGNNVISRKFVVNK